MSQIRNAVLIACSLAAVGGQARAQDQSTIHRLASHGGMSSAAAKKLAAKVSQRMARAADAPPTVMDPLRAALSQALVGSPMPADAMATAKVRLKLYAGLNEFALEALFAPQAGAIAACVRDVDATQSECEALVAAAGNSSVSKIRRVAGGPPPAPMMAAAPPVQSGYGAPPAGYGAPPANGSHFGGGYNSGYHAAPGYQGAPPMAQQQGFGGGYHPPAYQQNGYAPQGGYAQPPMQQGYAAARQPMPQQGYAAPAYAARPPAQQGYAAPAFAVRPPVQQGYAAPAPAARPAVAAPAPQPAYRPAPAPVAMAPAAPVVSAQDQAARKEAYRQQREAYLARQKQQFQERKDKAAGMETNPDAAPVGVASSKAAPAAAPSAKAAGKVTAPPAEEVAAADTKRPVPAAAPAAEKADSKPALDNSFLDGLLDDPLGGKGKK
jgi:hypothetical protein